MIKLERPKASFFCNKCGYFGEHSAHVGCDYLAAPSLEQLYIDQIEAENARLRGELAEEDERADRRNREIVELRRQTEELAAAEGDHATNN